MNRKRLAGVLGLVTLAGIALAEVPFLSAMSPSAKTFAERSRVPIPDLRPGTFAFAESPDWANVDWMFVRRLDGKLNVWQVPRTETGHAFPDRNWWGVWGNCKAFGPRFDRGVIACSDPDVEPWITQVYAWTLDGKALDPNIVDMIPVIGVEESGDWVHERR